MIRHEAGDYVGIAARRKAYHHADWLRWVGLRRRRQRYDGASGHYQHGNL
jgi:hypothetical protein